MASGLSPVTEVKEKEKSKIAEVTAPAGASIADKLSEPKDTSTPVKLTLPVNPGDEKSSLLNKLAELDKKQKQLQEKKELETLRKQVEEREEAVRELEKSLTEPVRKGKSKESSSGESGGAKPKKHKSRLAASFQEGQTPSTSTESGQSGTSLLNIDTLRQMPNLREQVRKELKKLGLEIAESSSSSTDSSSDSDSAEDEIDDTVVEQVLKQRPEEHLHMGQHMSYTINPLEASLTTSSSDRTTHSSKCF
ncbi:uncharacterized protein LOC128558337 [Mercenaria mercenaria]|uniref:uncharacterized protein LOC128558337 n=1 Tax=Mercenaria mercenaria TaxID=6596 RepID=UPI00234EA65E|nr:uncharacterized protein LOC128558337 [Mercenaria mercenaria]